MGLDHRIGSKFLHPGPGYGGSCFPKDTSAITKIAKEHGYTFRIVETVIEVNRLQRERMMDKIKTIVGGAERLDSRRARSDLQTQYRRHKGLSCD